MPVNQLSGDAPVSVDGITIDAPGLTGDVVVETGAGATRRGVGDQVPDQIRLAVRRHGGRARRTIRIESPSDAESGAKGATRGPAPVGGRRGRPSAMRIAVPRPRPGRAQVLLSRDEHGIVTWHVQQPPSGRDFSESVQVFEVGRAPSGPATRGFGLPKILQVISFPLVKAGGKLIEFKVREWDRDKHPNRVSAYGPDRSLTALDDAAWTRLSKGRCLLFIHGTFDTVAGCFTRLPDATLAALDRRYGGRMIGFDHPTLADSPIDNARAFFQIVGDRRLDVDIVCHSRGGLVTRAIAERPSDLANMGPNVRVGTSVLVGSTTNGSWLADIGHWNELIDRLTTMLSFAPVPAAVDALESVFALVRSLAVEVDHDLAGLDAMAPTRPYLKEVNAHPTLAPGGSYRAILSDYEPSDPDLKAFFADEFKDSVIFKGPNDGMVGVDEILGDGIAAPFPIADPCRFDRSEAIEHANYFGQDKTSKALLDWLSG